jgi:Skp family chaperone for outer membrane proteins
MKRAACLLVLTLSAAIAAAAPPKVAVVRVADVFRQLEGTVKANQLLQAKRAAINRDSRLTAYNTLYADLQARGKQLAAGGGKIDEATRGKLEREFAIKRQEAKSLLDDFESFRAERTKEINAEMVAGMKQRLDEIRLTAEKIAGDEGYDWVFDSSGNTNTGVPLLLYARNPNDLTDRVLAALGRAASSAEDAEPPAARKR